MIRCAFALLAALALQPGGAKKVTVGDLMQLRTIVDVELSPDGSRVAYVVSKPSLERNVHEPALFVMPTAGGEPAPIAADASIFTPTLPAPRLRWTPDNTSVSFLGRLRSAPDQIQASAGQGVVAGPQVLVTPAGGGASQPITRAPQGVAAFEWAPDGKSLAYITRDAAPRAPVVQVHAPPPVTRLWVQPHGGEARALSPDGQYVDSFTWAPDSAALVYSASSISGFVAPYYTRLYRVSLGGGGQPSAIVDRAGMNTSPQFSPDGSQVAFVTTHERVGLLAPRGLAVFSVGTRAIRSYPMNGAWIGEMTWAPDSQSLYVLMNEGTFATGEHMFEMPIVRVSIDAGRAERVVAGPVVNYYMSLSRDGRTLAYREVRPRSMGELVVREVATGRTKTLTNVNPELARLALGELKPIKWRSFDGMEIWGLLLTPPGYDGKSPRSLIVYCHGGPIGGVTYGVFPQFMHVPGQVDPYPVEALASAGFAVLFPMPRGGSGYGEAGHRAIINAWGEADYRDIMAGVDALIAQGLADWERLGVMGASYGGFMTNWIVTQTDRFKVASSGASVSELADLYYLTDAGEVMAEYFQKPWENRESYAAHSPLTFVERVNTPLLLQHGENDPRVPLASAQKFYRALKALNKTVEFDIFPRGGHVQYEPVAERASMQRNLEWFLRWIRP